MSALFAISLFAVLAFSGCPSSEFAVWRAPLDNTISQLSSQNPNFKMEIFSEYIEINNADNQIVEESNTNLSIVTQGSLRHSLNTSWTSDGDYTFELNAFSQDTDYWQNRWLTTDDGSGWQRVSVISSTAGGSNHYQEGLLKGLKMVLAGRVVPHRVSTNTYRTVLLDYFNSFDFYISIQNNRVASVRTNARQIHFGLTIKMSTEIKITYGNQTVSLPTEYQTGPQIAAPQNLTIDDNLVLRWDTADEDAFRHYVVIKNAQGTVVDSYPISLRATTFDGGQRFRRLPSGNYTFFVIVFNSHLNASGLSNPASATIQSFDKLETPTNLTIDDDNILRWDGVKSTSQNPTRDVVRIYYRGVPISDRIGFDGQFDLQQKIDSYGALTPSGSRFSGQLTIFVTTEAIDGTNMLESDYSDPIFIQI